MSKLSRETEALIERGREGAPLAPAHRARLKRAILARAAGGAVVMTATSAAAWTSFGARIVSGLVLVGAAIGAGAALSARAPARAPDGGVSAVVAGVASGEPGVGALGAAASAPTATSTSTPNAPSKAPLALLPTPAAAPKATPIPISTPTATPTPISTPTATPDPISTLTAPPTPPALAAPPAPPSLTLPGTALPSTVPVPAPGAPSLSTLEREASLLREADLALKSGDPGRALSLLDEHAATFPRSALEPERSAERVFALCRAGRVNDARNATDVFLREHPAGPLTARVKGACGAARE
jgi:hypothetical protein